MYNRSAPDDTDLASGIRALPNRANDTTDNGINSAILRYAGAKISDPTTQNTSGKLPLVETNLHVRSLDSCGALSRFHFLVAISAFPCSKGSRSFMIVALFRIIFA